MPTEDFRNAGPVARDRRDKKPVSEGSRVTANREVCQTVYIDLQCRRSILVQAGVLLQIEAAGGLFSTGTMSEQIMLISPFMFTLLSAQAPEHAEHRAVK